MASSRTVPKAVLRWIRAKPYYLGRPPDQSPSTEGLIMHKARFDFPVGVGYKGPDYPMARTNTRQLEEFRGTLCLPCTS